MKERRKRKYEDLQVTFGVFKEEESGREIKGRVVTDKDTGDVTAFAEDPETKVIEKLN